MNKKIKNWIYVLIWAGLIFFLSHQPFLESNLPGEWDFMLRKFAHVFEYAVLTYLLIRVLGEYSLSEKQILFSALVIALLYAISDEYHQTFIMGRKGTVGDVLIDSIGILSVLLIKRVATVDKS